MKKNEKKDNITTTKKNKKNIFEKINEFKLNNLGRGIDFKKKKYQYERANKNLDTQIEIDDIENESSKLKALKENAKRKIDNAKIDVKLSKLTRAIKFNEEIGNNDKIEIEETKKESNKFKKGSLAAGSISALTTIIGIYNQSDRIYVETFLFQAVALIFACILTSYLLNSITKFYNKFYEKKKLLDNILLIAMLIEIVGYTSYSIFTNFDFWNKYFKGIALLLFSAIYDLISVCMALLSYKYNSLDYNKNHKKEINMPFENNEENDEKIKNNVIDLKKTGTEGN